MNKADHIIWQMTLQEQWVWRCLPDLKKVAQVMGPVTVCTWPWMYRVVWWLPLLCSWISSLNPGQLQCSHVLFTSPPFQKETSKTENPISLPFLQVETYLLSSKCFDAVTKRQWLRTWGFSIFYGPIVLWVQCCRPGVLWGDNYWTYETWPCPSPSKRSVF